MNHDFPTNYIEEALASCRGNPSKNDLKGLGNAFAPLPLPEIPDNTQTPNPDSKECEIQPLSKS